MSADARILELKLQLPPAPRPLAVYKPLVLAGKMAYVSGHGPVKTDGGLILGRVGRFAKIKPLNFIAIIGFQIGQLL